MFVKIYLFSIISSFISGTLACNGCQITEFSVTGCSDSNDEILQLTCASMQLNDQCQILTNCSRVIVQPIQSAKLTISGSISGIEYNDATPDICIALKEMNFHGDGSKLMKSYELTETCENFKDYSKYEIRYRELEDDIKSQVNKGIGHSDVTIQLENVNGKEGYNACYNLKTSLTCAKHQRKPKTH